MNINQQLDHITNRVFLSTMTGFLFGGSHAIFKGYPALRASLQVSISCALASTACFGIERIIYNSLPHHEQSLYTSYTLSGILGGGLLGGIFQRRMGGGILLFTPLMISAAYTEIQFQSWKERKIQHLMKEQERQSKHS